MAAAIALETRRLEWFIAMNRFGHGREGPNNGRFAPKTSVAPPSNTSYSVLAVGFQRYGARATSPG